MIKKFLNQTPLRQRFHIILVAYCVLVSISAFISALIIFLIPSDTKNSILLGLSLQRMILMGSVFIPGVWMAILTVRTYRDEAWAKIIWSEFVGNEIFLGRIVQVTAVSFLAGWIISFTPLYVFADYKDYYIRISPLIHWLTLVSAITLAIGLIEKYGLHWPLLVNMIRDQKKALVVALISTVIFAAVWAFIAWTGFGIRIVEDYWYGTGVPILGIQVVTAFVIGIGVFLFERSSFKIRFPIRSDLLIFFVVWIVAAFFWAQEPLPESFFAPGPYLPDFEVHPYSDATLFDLGSQFALIGQGINNGMFFDRALYMGFLTFLHAFAGQNYIQVVAWQAAIYAAFPGILYLFGKAIHSRTFGVILAVLATLRGINGIAASTLIDLANQKQMLTDFPMVIFVTWFSLMLVKWMKSPQKNHLYILWAGGAMGLAVMLRTHALFLIGFAILSILIIFRRQRLRGVLVSFLLVLSMISSIFPWGMQNSGAFFEIYRSRIQSRYSPFLSPATPTSTPQGSIAPEITPPQASSLTTSRLLSSSRTSPDDLLAWQSRKDNIQTISFYTSVGTSFFHNLVTSVLIFPSTPVFHDLWHTVKEAAPFWQQDWNGKMGAVSIIFFIINLLLISLGIGISWKSAGNSGLVPLGIFFFYNLANGIARTSGGRYIVPADWIVFFYYALGLLQVIFWGMSLFGLKDNLDAANPPPVGTDPPSWTWQPLKKAPWVLITFLLIGSLLPLSEHLFPRRYPAQSQADLLAVLEQSGYLKEMGFDKAELSSALEQWPAFTIVNGRALYPRFFMENKGLSKGHYPYKVLEYPRLGFTLINPDGMNVAVLPQGEAPYFPNASDVIFLGCREEEFIDVLAIVILEEPPVIHKRQPGAPLQCPLPQPVCDENHNCR